MNKKLLNLEDVATYLNCSKSTMYRYVRENRISYIRRADSRGLSGLVQKS